MEADAHPDATADEVADITEALRDATNASRSDKARNGGGTQTSNPSTDVDPAVTATFRTAIDQLLDQLRAGAVLGRYDQGSLRLLLAEATRYLDAEPSTEDA